VRFGTRQVLVQDCNYENLVTSWTAVSTVQYTAGKTKNEISRGSAKNHLALPTRTKLKNRPNSLCYKNPPFLANPGYSGSKKAYNIAWFIWAHNALRTMESGMTL
jgi:hypothetical protein